MSLWYLGSTRLTKPASAILVLISVGLVALGCAPSSSRPQSSSGAPTDIASAPAPRVLRMGMISSSEPTQSITFASSAGGGEHPFMLHGALTVYDAEGTLQPHLAQSLPTLENGDWKVMPDGRMEVTWKLRRDVRWHDGTPLTAADFVFGSQVIQDREMPIARPRALAFMSEVVALDDSTVLVRWRQTYVFANVSGAEGGGILPAVPRHLLADLYTPATKQDFVNAPYWTREFIGLGPYRLTDWVLGSQMELAAVDGYFLGRPKVDRVVVRYMGDVNALVASLLAGDIDMTTMGAMKAEQLVTVKNAWEPAGLGTAYGEFNGARNYRFQYRDSTAPWAQDVRVRRALIHMLDRQTLADTLIYGMTRPADTLPPTDDPVYALVEQKGLAKYPYDLARAQRLLGEAGWEKGPDGSYRSARAESAGAPLGLEVRTSSKTDNVREGQALAGEWKAAGLNTSTAVVPDSAANKDELKAIFPGVLGWPIDYTPEALQDWITTQIPTASGGWRGRNFGGYTNPQYDALYDQLLVTLEAPRRDAIYADMLKMSADDALSIFLYYDMQTNTVAHRKGVLGITKTSANQRINAWNIQTWTLE